MSVLCLLVRGAQTAPPGSRIQSALSAAEPSPRMRRAVPRAGAQPPGPGKAEATQKVEPQTAGGAVEGSVRQCEGEGSCLRSEVSEAEIRWAGRRLEAAVPPRPEGGRGRGGAGTGGSSRVPSLRVCCLRLSPWLGLRQNRQ